MDGLLCQVEPVVYSEVDKVKDETVCGKESASRDTYTTAAPHDHVVSAAALQHALSHAWGRLCVAGGKEGCPSCGHQQDACRACTTAKASSDSDDGHDHFDCIAAWVRERGQVAMLIGTGAATTHMMPDTSSDTSGGGSGGDGDDGDGVHNASGTNPVYLTHGAMRLVVQLGIAHLVVDVPSVDREDDGGGVVNHRLFWGLTMRTTCTCVTARDSDDCQVLICEACTPSGCGRTITELAMIPRGVASSHVMVAVQLPAIHVDAVPSRVLICVP